MEGGRGKTRGKKIAEGGGRRNGGIDGRGGGTEEPY